MTGLYVLEKNDRMRLVSVSSFPGEDVSEKCRANAQHELVSLENDGLARAAGQSHIGKQLGGTKILHYTEETVVVVVPLEEELLLLMVVLHNGLNTWFLRPRLEMVTSECNGTSGFAFAGTPKKEREWLSFVQLAGGSWSVVSRG